MNGRNSRATLRYQLAGSLVLATLALAGQAMADGVCPARPVHVDAAKDKKRDLAKMSPMANAMYLADRAYDDGQYDVAEAQLQKLVGTPPDKGDTAHRALVRLARIRAQQGRLDEAVVLAQKAGRSSQPKIRRVAAELISDITYRKAVNAAKGDFDRADALYDDGQLDASEAAFTPLIDHACPVPDQYYDRVKLKLAGIRIKKNDLDGAAARLATVNRANPDIAEIASQADATLAQKRLDQQADAAFDAARVKSEAGDFAGAVAADQQALAAYPNASPRILLGGRLTLADHISHLGRFDEARGIVSAASIEAGDTEMADRRDRVLGRINEREMDARGAKLFADADGDVTGYRYGKALASYNAVINSTYYDQEWQQRARLRKASILRREFDFGGAHREIDTVLASPATPVLGDNAKAAASDLAQSMPDKKFTSSFGGGLRVDDNAPVIVAAIPGEEGTTPYPSNKRFADTATAFSMDAGYRRRLGDSYNYLEASAGLDVVDQWTLNAIDQTRFTAQGGILIHIPSQIAKVETGLLYQRSNRGGKYLNQSLGVFTDYTRVLGKWRAVGHVELAHVDDVRPGRDGWHEEISAEIMPAGADYGFRGGVALAREQTKGKALRQTLITLSGQYGWAVKTVGDWQIDGVVAGSWRPDFFDVTTTTSSGATRKKFNTRTRLTVGPVITFKDQIEIRAGYQYLSIDSNDLSYVRSDNQFFASVTRRF